MFLIFNFENP